MTELSASPDIVRGATLIENDDANTSGDMMTFAHTIRGVLTLAGLAVAGAGQAHPKLLSTVPAANSSVAKPTKIALRFSETLIAPMTAADLIMTRMPGMAAKPMKMSGFTTGLAADHKTLVLSMKQPLPIGTYQVNWHAVSTDTHRVRGSFTFSVK